MCNSRYFTTLPYRDVKPNVMVKNHENNGRKFLEKNKVKVDKNHSVAINPRRFFEGSLKCNDRKQFAKIWHAADRMPRN